MFLPPYLRDIHGNVFPPAPVERELFYRDDLHRWYIYNGSAWVEISGVSTANLDDLADVNVPAPADGHFLSYSVGLRFWQGRLLADTDIPAAIARDAEVAAAVAAEAAARDAAIAAEAAARAAADAAHAGQTAVGTHGSAVLATPNLLVHRDAAGRSQIANPAANPDIDNMGSRAAADAAHAALTAVGIHGSAVLATPNLLVHRDAAGRSQIADPAANPDIDNMGSRDAAIAIEAAARAAADAAEAAARAAADAAHAALTAVGIHGSAVLATPNLLIHRDGAGRAQIANPAANPDIDNMSARNAAIAAHTGLATGVHGVSGTIVGTTDTQDITNKRIQPRVSSAASGDISPSVATADIYIRTAQAAALTINNPTGSPAQGEKLIIRLKDNGTARTITFGSQYRGLEFALPAATVAGKLLYMGFMYNSTDTKWDMLAINQE